MTSWKVMVVGILFLGSVPLWAQTPIEAQKIKSQADHLQDQAAEAVDEGKMQQGLDLMARAVSLDPVPTRRMNYGSMLYGDGIEIFRNIDQEKGRQILQQAEDQLRKAIAAFNPNTDQVYLSQSYFLLGEIYIDAFGDQVKAKEYFKRAAALSDYTGAKDALNKLSQ